MRNRSAAENSDNDFEESGVSDLAACPHCAVAYSMLRYSAPSLPDPEPQNANRRIGQLLARYRDPVVWIASDDESTGRIYHLFHPRGCRVKEGIEHGTIAPLAGIRLEVIPPQASLKGQSRRYLPAILSEQTRLVSRPGGVIAPAKFGIVIKISE